MRKRRGKCAGAALKRPNTMEHAYWPLRGVRETDRVGGRATANVLLGNASSPKRPHFTWPNSALYGSLELRVTCRALTKSCWRSPITAASPFAQCCVLRLVRPLADPVEET